MSHRDDGEPSVRKAFRASEHPSAVSYLVTAIANSTEELEIFGPDSFLCLGVPRPQQVFVPLPVVW